ncbi:hypothetical protein HK102_003267, partial [Quaeritorhiza haematococci]
MVLPNQLAPDSERRAKEKLNPKRSRLRRTVEGLFWVAVALLVDYFADLPWALREYGYG